MHIGAEELQVDLGVRANQLRSTRQVAARKIFPLQSRLAIIGRKSGRWNDGFLAQKIRSGNKRHLSRGKLLANSLQRCDRVRRCAAVISVQDLNRIGQGTNHQNLLYFWRQGQHAVVLQQDHRLARRLQCELPVCCAVNLRFRRLGVRYFLWRIEEAQAHPRREQPPQGNVEIGLGEQSLLNGVDEWNVIVIIFCDGEEVGTLVVHAFL